MRSAESSGGLSLEGGEIIGVKHERTWETAEIKGVADPAQVSRSDIWEPRQQVGSGGVD